MVKKFRNVSTKLGTLSKCFVAKANAFYWETLVGGVFAGLGIYVMVQNAPGAKNLGGQIITTLQSTIIQMLTGNF